MEISKESGSAENTPRIRSRILITFTISDKLRHFSLAGFRIVDGVKGVQWIESCLKKKCVILNLRLTFYLQWHKQKKIIIQVGRFRLIDKRKDKEENERKRRMGHSRG